MLRLVCCVVLCSSALGATNYDAGDGHSRRETVDPNGDIRGEYTYVDPAGKTIAVRYSAGRNGFQIENPGTASPVAYATTPVPPSAPEYRNFPGLPPQFQYQPNPFLVGPEARPTPRPQEIPASPTPPSVEDYRQFSGLPQFRQQIPQNIQFQPVPVTPAPGAEFRNFQAPENIQFQPFSGAPQPAPVFENQPPTPTDQANSQQRFFAIPAGFNPSPQPSTPQHAQFVNEAAARSAAESGSVPPFNRALFAPSTGSERAESARQIQQYSEELRNETSQAPQSLPAFPTNTFSSQRFAPLPPLAPEQRQIGREQQFLPGQAPQQFVPLPAPTPQGDRRFEFLPPGFGNTPNQLSFDFPASAVRGHA